MKFLFIVIAQVISVYGTSSDSEQWKRGDVPPKGHKFPRIPGPKTDDDICIVGAGPAGIHMAVLLKRMGLTKLRIFEKSNRVGGKCFDVEYDGISRPMGAIFGEPNYLDNLVPLAEEYGVGERIPILTSNIWTWDDSSYANMTAVWGGKFLQQKWPTPHWKMLFLC